MVCRTLLVLACVLTTNAAWAADMWILGNPAGGWSASNGYKMVQSSETDYWVILHMENGWNFSFTSSLASSPDDWSSMNGGRLCPYENNYEIYNSGYTCAPYGQHTDCSFRMSGETGYYTISINSSSRYMEIHPIRFTVAGSSLDLFGGTNAWDILPANDMEYNSVDKGWYKTYSHVELTEGNIEFKVLKNGSFEPSYPANNYILNIPDDGTYDVSINLDVNNNVSVNLVKLLAHDATNFPDNNFRSYLTTTFPTQTADGYWTPEELAEVTSIDCSGQSIKTLKGIENFTALTTFDCSNNNLTSIDLTSNTALTSTTLGEQTVDFPNNVVKKITCGQNTYFFIWLNNEYNGQDPSFTDIIKGLEGNNGYTFDMDRLTWGEGCEYFEGEAQNANNTTSLRYISDGLDPDLVAGDVLLVSLAPNATVSNPSGTFKYTYAAIATPEPQPSKDNNEMEVIVNWTGSGVPTSIDAIDGSEVKSTRYYNLMGVESATPFQGVNIIVKEYTNGSCELSKVIMR